MLLCGLNCWWSVCMLQTIAYLPTPHRYVWEHAFGLLRAHCMTASVKAYPISPTLPKNTNIHLQDSLSSDEDNPQCGVSYTGFHHPLFIFSLLGEDPLRRG